MQDSQLYDVNIKRINPLVSPKALVDFIPVSERARSTVLRGRQEIVQILEGKDRRLMLVVGPCSIHDVAGALEYARLLKDLSGKISDRILMVMRTYFDKPRTTIGWKGFISDPKLNGTFGMPDGLEQARRLLKVIAELGLLCATEFVNPIVPQYLADLVCWNALGARTVESQTHREVASGLSMPVGCKNGTGGNEYSVQIAVDAMETMRHPHSFPSITDGGVAAEVQTRGNTWGHLVLRGGQAGTNFDRASVQSALQKLDGRNVCQQLVVDCSHGNCQKRHELQPVAFRDVLAQRIDGNTRIVGIMLESNLAEGRQDHDPFVNDPGMLEYGKSITDPCVGWEETLDLIYEAYEALGTQIPVSA